MVTPTEAKIDIEIKNFNYINNSSQIALYTKLKSDKEYEEEDETEDEENEYAEDEKEVKTTSNGYTGIFTWAEKAEVDGVSKEVLTSDIEEDDEKYEKIYLKEYLSIFTKIQKNPEEYRFHPNLMAKLINKIKFQQSFNFL